MDLVIVSNADDVGHVFQSKNFIDRPDLDVITHFRKKHDVGMGIAFR
jgi:hypothetical protein